MSTIQNLTVSWSKYWGIIITFSSIALYKLYAYIIIAGSGVSLYEMKTQSIKFIVGYMVHQNSKYYNKLCY